jgi:hypothetical protein
MTKRSKAVQMSVVAAKKDTENYLLISASNDCK